MKDDFLTYQAQTSPYPLSIEIRKAKGCYIYDNKGKKYLDFVAGVSANSLGHQHPKVTKAIKKQLNSYTHVMVYGEFIQEQPLQLCKLLSQTLPNTFSVYLTNSGTEACEGALKLAKRFTKRHEIIAAHHSYHGNTQGSMSVSGAEVQLEAVATIKISVLDICLFKSEMFFTNTSNLPAINFAFSSDLLIKVICLFEVCLTKFSQVFLPFYPCQTKEFFLILNLKYYLIYI